ncbi:MAG: flavin reductase family protein [Blautia sp.]|nr:flavin reductase family protein [Blautia sp.]
MSQSIKKSWKPGNMLYPLPAVMVSCADGEGIENVFTVAWAGTVCTNPPMLSISVRPSRFSYGLIQKSGEFVVNLATEDMVKAVDYCGVVSGRDVDKFERMHLTKEKADVVKAPLIGQAPVNIECKVREEIPLGSHSLFIAEVVMVHVSEEYLDETNKFHLDEAKLLVYNHGEYMGLGKKLGGFGMSVKKKAKAAGKAVNGVKKSPLLHK